MARLVSVWARPIFVGNVLGRAESQVMAVPAPHLAGRIGLWFVWHSKTETHFENGPALTALDSGRSVHGAECTPLDIVVNVGTEADTTLCGYGKSHITKKKPA